MIIVVAWSRIWLACNVSLHFSYLESRSLAKFFAMFIVSWPRYIVLIKCLTNKPILFLISYSSCLSLWFQIGWFIISWSWNHINFVFISWTNIIRWATIFNIDWIVCRSWSVCNISEVCNSLGFSNCSSRTFLSLQQRFCTCIVITWPGWSNSIFKQWTHMLR